MGLGLLVACTWVPLSDGGQGVRVAHAEDTAGCASLGTVNAQTTDRVLGVARSDVKIREELAGLARNQAADMGGDTVVPTSTPEHGRQRFDVYRCRGEAEVSSTD